MSLSRHASGIISEAFRFFQDRSWVTCRRFTLPFPRLARTFSALFLLLVASGCIPHEKRADIVIVNGKEPESLDPGTLVGQPDERVCLSIFEGLTRYNEVTADPEPGLSDHWDKSPDGRVYT